MPIVYYYLLNVQEVLTYFKLKVTTRNGSILHGHKYIC